MIYTDEVSAVTCGFIKFGYKKLYFYKQNGQMVESECKCVLDFYVNDSYQRKGIGIKLFNKMLEVLSL